MLCRFAFESLPSGRLAETGDDKDESRGWDFGLLAVWQRTVWFIVAAVVFVVTKQYNGSADVTACAISSARCAVVVVMDGVVCRVLDCASPLPPLAYVAVNVALSDYNGVVTHDFTHCTPKKGESHARS